MVITTHWWQSTIPLGCLRNFLAFVWLALTRFGYETVGGVYRTEELSCKEPTSEGSDSFWDSCWVTSTVTGIRYNRRWTWMYKTMNSRSVTQHRMSWQFAFQSNYIISGITTTKASLRLRPYDWPFYLTRHLGQEVAQVGEARNQVGQLSSWYCLLTVQKHIPMWYDRDERCLIST